MKHQYIQPILGVASSAVVLANIDTFTTVLAVIIGVVNTAVLLVRVFLQVYTAIKKHIKGEATADEIVAELKKIESEVEEHGRISAGGTKPDSQQSGRQKHH